MTLPAHVAAYAEIFRNHQESFQAHLNGRVLDTDPLPPSFFPPSSRWTSSEKDLFFHGLAVYSRLRPDLIAQHVKTKTTFDVCAYLDVLEAAVQREHGEIPKTLDRRAIEPAMELSERWVQHEEASAASLSALDSCSPGAKSTLNDDHCSHVPNSPSEQQFDPETMSSAEELESKERYGLGFLDSTCLTVLENVIREAEVDDTENKEMSTSDPTLTSNVPVDTPRDYTVSQRPCEYHQTLHEEMSQSTTSDQPAARIPAQKRLKNALNLSSKYDLLRRLRKRLYMRRKRAEQTGRTVVPGSVKLRPGRQRRTRKPPKPRPKTYNTRRKLQLGESRRGLVKDHLDSPGKSSVSSEAMEDEDMLYESHSKGGTTKPYRVRKFFQEHGVDAQALASMDLTLFHLSTLARLIRLYYSVHESNVDADDASISADAIRFLGTVTTEFVSEIIRRVIITKEQEIRLKRELKVWKYDRDEITAENILESLNSMGFGRLKKEEYFTKMLQETDHGTPSQQALSGEQETESREKSIERTNIEGLLHTHQAPVALPQSLLCNLMGNCRPLSDSSHLADDVNEDEVQRELEEEEELDMEDARSSREFEKSLWDLN